MVKIAKNSPEIRFKIFNKNWKKANIGEFYFFKNGLNKEKKFFGHGTPIINFKDVFNNRGIYFKELNGRVLLSDSEINRYSVQMGDLFFTRTSESINEIGFPSVMLDNPLKTVFSGFVLRGRSINYDPLDNLFKQYVFFTNAFRQEMIKKSSITTRALTSGTALKEMFFNFPVEKKEQSKIGIFFQILDKKIEQQENKIEQLKKQKQGLLQKMFPKENQSIPEFRFNGFKNNWKNEKLSDITTHRNASAIEKYFSTAGTYKVISIGSYSVNNKYIDQKLYAIFNNETEKNKVSENELTMVLNDKTQKGNIIGRVLLIQENNKFVVNQRTEIIVPKKNLNPLFAYFIINYVLRKKIKRIAQGGTQIYVNYRSVEILSLSLPSLQEQEKIGMLFERLDKNIELNEKKLELLKQQKQGFLQKMFI